MEQPAPTLLHVGVWLQIAVERLRSELVPLTGRRRAEIAPVLSFLQDFFFSLGVND